ncbi:hypothetical protein [Paraburkholderia caribensis]|uniref:hypothetical protein n=1 Tax=Paraburkholderia caribensis TaxID=75105 RepID=UPI0034D261EA
MMPPKIQSIQKLSKWVQQRTAAQSRFDAFAVGTDPDRKCRSSPSGNTGSGRGFDHQIAEWQFAQGGEGWLAQDQCGDTLVKFLLIETSRGRLHVSRGHDEASCLTVGPTYMAEMLPGSL